MVEALFAFHHGKVRPWAEIPVDCFGALCFQLKPGVPTARTEIGRAAVSAGFKPAQVDAFLLHEWASLDVLTMSPCHGWVTLNVFGQQRMRRGFLVFFPPNVETEDAV